MRARAGILAVISVVGITLVQAALSAAPSPDPPPAARTPEPPPATSAPASPVASTPTQTSPSRAASQAKAAKPQKQGKQAVAKAEPKSKVKAARRTGASVTAAEPASAVAATQERAPIPIPKTPVGHAKKDLRDQVSDALGPLPIVVAGAGLFLLGLAALEPRFVHPRRLRRSFSSHRGGVATAGVLLLLSIGIAYLVSWGGAV